MRTSLLSILAALALGATLPGVAAAADIGSEDFNYAPLTGAATGSKPESKLWFNDGIWWGALFNPASGQHRIHRLNTTTQQWTSTAATIDARRGSRSDVLWDGASNKLYAASHIIAETSSGSTTPANSGRVSRYSYNASTDTYTLDPGFPVTINTVKTETMVLDKDSTGRLWATWTVGNRAWVAHTNGTDTAWGTPYQVPGVPALDSDDISSLIHFGGNKIGVLVSNQLDDKFWFAVHNDGAGDAAADWSAATIPGLPISDDHINLKKDSTGRIFAAVKTSESAKTAPLTVLLRRNLDGTWSSTTFGTGSNSHTRPIVLIDEPANQARMYATCPQAPAFTSGQSGGDICEKVTSLDTLAFPSGIGTAVIRDEGSAEMNDATSTKQGVNAFTGAVVVANNPTTDVYWHRYQSLGGTPPPAGVTAQFTGTPTSGTAPLDVVFSDTSTGSPTTWSWAFGDGGTSNLQNPSHQYTASGTYTVTLTASKTGSTDTMTRTSYITVGSVPPPGGTQTFPAVADANTKSTSPTANYGTATTLRARQGTSATDATYRSYLRFDVQGLAGTVTGVKLRLFSTDGSKDGGAVYGLGSGAGSFWSETGITWNSQPALPASSLASLGVTSTNAAVEVDLGAGAVSGNGPHSFAIQNASTDSAIYSSREGATRPELVVTTDAGGPPPPPPPGGPTAQFTGTPTSGQAPLNVTFSDTSTGSPTSWSWSFGDGGTSTAQNPTHVYSAPGSYDVTLTATSADGSDAETKTGYITVGSAPPPGGGQTILPMADAHAKSTSATTNYGAIDHIRLRQGTSATDATYVSYLKFEVTGLTGPVSGAKLRLFTYDGGPDGGSVFEVDDTWAENTLTWNARPAVGPTSIASAGTVADNTTVEWDLGTTITGNGVYSFAITTTSTNSVYFRSRESAQPPELVLPG